MKSSSETNNRTLENPLFRRILADVCAVTTGMQVIDDENSREGRGHEAPKRRRPALAERREANQMRIWQLEHQAGAWSWERAAKLPGGPPDSPSDPEVDAEDDGN